MKGFIRFILITYVLIFGNFGLLNSLCAQNTVSLYLIDKGWNLDTNIIELRATHFQRVGTMHFSLKELNNQGDFAGIDQIQLMNFQPGVNSTYNSISKTISVSWDVLFINGFNIPDGQLVFRILWKSNPALPHCYEFVQSPIPTEIKDPNLVPQIVKLYNSCDAFVSVPSFFNAFIDVNKNCNFEFQEELFTQYTILDSFNNQISTYKNPQNLFYSKQEFGLHFYKIIPVTSLWTACNNYQTILIDSTSKIIALSYGMQAAIDCPELSIEINTPIVRRCVDYNYYLHYENIGTLAADSAKVIVKLDPFMTFKGASIPILNFQKPFVEFYIGKVDVFKNGNFTITVNIDCDSTIIGQTHCVSAEIVPHKDCIIPANWSGASIQLDAKCEDGKNKFRIQNVGTQDMPDPVQYWIVEDDIMPGLKKDIKLNKGSFFDIEYPANGKTYRLITDQVKNHPGLSYPSRAIEACGKNGNGGISTGYYLMFPENEEDPNIAIDCQASRGSFDPNDKSASPIGYQSDHFIESHRTLEYKIRFQNTGNDTAFKVVIVDTLSEWLDLSTLKILNASHPFSFSLINRVLSFRFDPIYLPYQSIDDANSQGFVQYSIKPYSKAALGTRLPNTASIYFDFNTPIQTNTTFHTLNRDFIIVSIKAADPSILNVNIYPNPGTDYLILETDQLSPEKDIQLSDLNGRVLLNQKWNGNRCIVQLNDAFKSGTYILNIYEKAKLLYRATIALKTKN
ncbi:MAG TPA: T9SS type A sorting domain-containing protein [Saprospiraceae bacterium]|nr:T9SS type A sorting domain-containing protein [Saprospiraceae bacterium]